jgi:hypothetical protein
VYTRDPKSARNVRRTRPPFGLGPIARVSTVSTLTFGAVADRASAANATRSGRAVAIPIGPEVADVAARRRAFGLPNLRRNVCPHFYLTGARGALPIQAPHLLKGLARQESSVSRCQVRGGVHLEASYVSDVCLSPRFNQCVFYEENLAAI